MPPSPADTRIPFYEEPGVGSIARHSLLAQAATLKVLTERPCDDIVAVAEALARSEHRLLLTGIGKSASVARNLAELFSASGTPAYFLHPTDALHGDLGMVSVGDDVIATSWSGSTDPLLRLLPHLKRRQARVTALVGYSGSPLAAHSDLVVAADLSDLDQPVGPPTTETLGLLALGHALVLSVFHAKNLPRRLIADLHPATWKTA